MPGVSHRSPFPFSIKLNGVGYMLGAAAPSSGGAPAAEPTFTLSKPQDQTSVVPTDFGPSALNPAFERTQIYDDLAQGMGQRLQSASRVRGYRWLIGADQRYYYALGVDASSARQIIMGPSITSLTPTNKDATNGVRKFFEVGGKLFALNGRYVNLRTSDGDWDTSVQDLGSGKAATDVAVFYSNGAAGNLAYIAMGDAEKIWKFDGTSFTHSVENLFATAFCIVGREFWRATGNTVSKCDVDADPFVLANWTTSYTVGDKQSNITGLVCTPQGVLLILKTDGVYSLDTAGWDHNLFPALHAATDAENGKYYEPWLDHTYISYRDGCYRVDGNLGREEIGPEKLTDNASIVKGRVTALAGHDTFNLYAGLYNDDTGNSHLMKFGGWDSPQDAEAERVDAWHGSISQTFSTKKIQALYRATTGNHGADSGHARMFIGFSDGTLAWFQLPCTPNPAACTNYKFSTTDSYLYLPTATMGFPSDPKSIRAFEVGGPVLNTGSYVTVQYRTAFSGAFTTFLDSTGATALFQTAPMGRIDVDGTVTISSTNLDFALILSNTATTTTPIVNYFGVHYQDRPNLRLMGECYVLASNYTVRRDGTPYRLGPQVVRDNLKVLADSANPFSAVLPDESSDTLTVVDYQETQVWSDRTRGWHAGIKLTLAETKSFVAPNAAGTYARLEEYTYGQLESYTYAQLEALL